MHTESLISYLLNEKKERPFLEHWDLQWALELKR